HLRTNLPACVSLVGVRNEGFKACIYIHVPDEPGHFRVVLVICRDEIRTIAEDIRWLHCSCHTEISLIFPKHFQFYSNRSGNREIEIIQPIRLVTAVVAIISPCSNRVCISTGAAEIDGCLLAVKHKCFDIVPVDVELHASRYLQALCERVCSRNSELESKVWFVYHSLVHIR